MLATMIDSMIGVVSPQWQERRLASRLRAQAMERALAAGKIDRQTRGWKAPAEAGDPRDLGAVQRARQRAFDLAQNNHYAAKLARVIGAQVVGCGLKPESQAILPGGKPYQEFRDAAAELWTAWVGSPDIYGSPGRGGSTFDELTVAVLKECVLAGECLVRIHRLSDEETAARGMPIPLAVEVIESERLDEGQAPLHHPLDNGNVVFRGIEFDPQGRRVAYHVRRALLNDPAQPFASTEIDRVPVGEMLHVFTPTRPSARRGVTWMAPGALQIRDIGDYQFDEMQAARVGACFAAAITSESGAFPGSLTTPSGDRVTDVDGNAISRLQPGLLLSLQPGEKLETIAPTRPNTAADSFIAMMLRGVSASVPGVKSSTLIGDYRQSSYSSEKSADNDTWRETEQVQEWLASHLCQPIWEEVIAAGILSGWFSRIDLRVFRPTRFAETRRQLMPATWSGPVAKSINPVDEEKASELAIKIGTSSLPAEAAGRGFSWRQLLKDTKQVLEYATEIGLPESFVLGMLGIAAPVTQPADNPDGKADDKPKTDTVGAANEEPGE